MITLNRNVLILALALFSSAQSFSFQSKTSLLQCEVQEISGKFYEFKSPIKGEKTTIDLSNPNALKLIFDQGGLLPGEDFTQVSDYPFIRWVSTKGPSEGGGLTLTLDFLGMGSQPFDEYLVWLTLDTVDTSEKIYAAQNRAVLKCFN